MKRAIDQQAAKAQASEDKIIVPRAKPLQKDEEQLVELHRTLTQHWRANASPTGGDDFFELGLTTSYGGAGADLKVEEWDTNLHYSKLKGIIEVGLFPEELLKDEFVLGNHGDHMPLMHVEQGNTIHKIDEVMKREANYVENEDEKAENKMNENEVEIEHSLFHDNDEMLVGDYNYSFCDDDDIL